MKIFFSWSTTIICTTLAALMLRASYWQYTRYISKTAYIAELDRRLKLPVENFSDSINELKDFSSIIHRRLRISGTWDYAHEIILRNRKSGEMMGAHVITPLKLDSTTGSEKYLLVSRGFIPLEYIEPDKRKVFQRKSHSSFVGLVQDSVPKKIFAPADPEVIPGGPWVDAWLRVDIPNIQKEMPYQLYPVFAEVMPNEGQNIIADQFLEKKSERDAILFLPGAGDKLQSVQEVKSLDAYPTPAFDPVAPPGRHYSYIFEWAIMALFTGLIGLVLQMRPRKT